MQTGAEKIHTIVLADDDPDDRLFFSDALSAISGAARLQVVENGVELMLMLQKDPLQPDLIFLDLNMPCKNGFECLTEIKQHGQLKHLPVVIISTSIQPEAVNYVYRHGACLYIVKPNHFDQLKKMIETVLLLHREDKLAQTPREKFIIQS